MKARWILTGRQFPAVLIGQVSDAQVLPAVSAFVDCVGFWSEERRLGVFLFFAVNFVTLSRSLHYQCFRDVHLAL